MQQRFNCAEAAGFDLVVTTGKNMRHQQNLTGRTIAIILVTYSNGLN